MADESLKEERSTNSLCDSTCPTKWYVDSGSTYHLSNEKIKFTSMRKVEGINIRMACGEQVPAEAIGNVEFITCCNGVNKIITLKNICYSPKFSNVISMYNIMENGYIVEPSVESIKILNQRRELVLEAKGNTRRFVIKAWTKTATENHFIDIENIVWNNFKPENNCCCNFLYWIFNCKRGSVKEVRHADDWLIDSGAPVHSSHNKSEFTSMRSVDGKYLKMGSGEKVLIEGIGNVEFFVCTNGVNKFISLKNVYYSPIIDNLISMYTVMESGYKVEATLNSTKILLPSGKLLLEAKAIDKLLVVKTQKIDEEQIPLLLRKYYI